MPLDQLTDEDIDTEGKEMSFLDHLEELRWHIIRAAAAILVFTVTAFIFIDDIFEYVLLGPAKTDFWTYRQMCKLADYTGYADLCVKKLTFKLQALGLSDQFTMSLTSSFFVGLSFAFPYAFWEVWRFIKPGLRPSEKRAARGAVFFVSLLFSMGLLFGYFIVSPLAINFLVNYTLSSRIENNIDITSYIGVIVTLALGCGLIFQMPIVAFVLSKVGVLTPAFMREYRRHSWIVILVVAGIITPSPDLYSQILVALPLALLYEISIVVSGRVQRARLKDNEALMQS
ncbi:twin-arginine translocase subunit TatC [Spirosoma sordidisoli]|uniref:Sec-independent protein translocase protein TatC n=1 Tax=Spirosoma sordidisoli TaxID=2502893 RepID=A0A4Q2UH72_9BACT|nr:twin-arginine translocase subunit TatC [Spirosoma sordidisoli]RYC68514.1 twin-arginine translocase subunit TatC [Spirosoma sordidisoli]